MSNLRLLEDTEEKKFKLRLLEDEEEQKKEPKLRLLEDTESVETDKPETLGYGSIKESQPSRIEKFIKANVPEETRKMYSSGKLEDTMALLSLAGVKKGSEALYFPFKKLLETPISEVSTAIQEGRSLREGFTRGQPFRKAPEDVKD